MRKLYLAWVLALPGVLSAASVTDDRGRTVEIPVPPHRVISLSPHLTELMFAAGAGDRLAGVVAYSDYPAEAAALPVVGDAFAVDQERIARIGPDLILAWAGGNPIRVIQHLEDAGYPVVALAAGDLDRIGDQIELLGRIMGTDEAAMTAAASYRSELAALEQSGPAAGLPTFVQIAAEPLYTVGGPHLISDLLRRCGADNIFQDISSLAVQVSYEAVLERAPAMIIASVADPSEDWRAIWARWPELPAVRDGRLIGVPADLISRPTPRILQGMRRVCEAVRGR